MNLQLFKLPNSTYLAVTENEFNGYLVREQEILLTKSDLLTYLTALIETESPKLAFRKLNYAEPTPLPFAAERSEDQTA